MCLVRREIVFAKYEYQASLIDEWNYIIFHGWWLVDEQYYYDYIKIAQVGGEWGYVSMGIGNAGYSL